MKLSCTLCLSCAYVLKEKGKYDVAVGTQKTSEELVKFWQELLHRYPSIIAIIDPMRKQVFVV